MFKNKRTEVEERVGEMMNDMRAWVIVGSLAKVLFPVIWILRKLDFRKAEKEDDEFFYF